MHREQVCGIDGDQPSILARVQRNICDDSNAQSEPHVSFDHIRIARGQCNIRSQTDLRERLMQR
jgi:hypothetical protein